jgi:hypothetical protein
VSATFILTVSDEDTMIPIDRFLFALEMYNDDRVKLPEIKLKEMDPGMFKTLLNNPSMKALFSGFLDAASPESAVKVDPISLMKPESVRSSASSIPSDVMERLRSRNVRAHAFWEENFMSPECVDLSLFVLALDSYNVDNVDIPKITLPMIGAKEFNVLINGPLRQLFPVYIE